MRLDLLILFPKPPTIRRRPPCSTCKSFAREITTQVTTSEVYSRLMSHVVYQAIKSYLQERERHRTQGSRCVNVDEDGSVGVSTAAPKLEKAVDKQPPPSSTQTSRTTSATAKRYLDKVLDKKVLTVVVDEVWDTNAKATVAEPDQHGSS